MTAAERKFSTTASASSAAGRVRGWEAGDSRPAALASAVRMSMRALFSQWTPASPPASLIRARARYISPSGSIMAG